VLAKEEIINWLKCEDEAELAKLYDRADKIRKENVGDEVHLRGLIEISNYCARLCAYCGIRAENKVTRYRMSKEEIVESALMAKKFGYGTVVLQAGEDYHFTADYIADIIKEIKVQTGMAITLSLGEKSYKELKQWKEAGANRYLIRFETSNPELFKKIHPPLKEGMVCDRFEVLKSLRELGYEVGSGALIGIPGQSYDDLANDILKFKEIDLDMIGVGPFIPHPDTPLGKNPEYRTDGEQVPSNVDMAFKVVALTRIMCPKANIPSTTAVSTLGGAKGRAGGLAKGGNVIMPNMTPVKYRKLYEIYPSKAGSLHDAQKSHDDVIETLTSIGRFPSTGLGNSKNYESRK